MHANNQEDCSIDVAEDTELLLGEPVIVIGTGLDPLCPVSVIAEGADGHIIHSVGVGNPDSEGNLTGEYPAPNVESVTLTFMQNIAWQNSRFVLGQADPHYKGWSVPVGEAVELSIETHDEPEIEEVPLPAEEEVDDEDDVDLEEEELDEDDEDDDE